jgi:hypothetical protein
MKMLRAIRRLVSRTAAALRPGRLHGDLWLSVLCISGTLAICGSLWTDAGTSPRSASSGTAVGALAKASADVRRRPARALFWEVLRPGDRLYDRDAVFVPPGVDAKVELQDGSRLELDQDTLTVFESLWTASKAGPPLAVTLSHGSVAGQAGAHGLALSTAALTAHLDGQTQAELMVAGDREARLDVQAGAATLAAGAARTTLGSGQGGTLDAAGHLVHLRESALVVDSPPRNARIYYSGSPPVIQLRWRQDGFEHPVEVASSRDFSRPIVAARPKDGAFAFKPPRAGIYYWRVGERDGDFAAPRRKLVVTERVAPLPLTPSDGGVVQQAAGPLYLSWTAVAGAERYALELTVLEGAAAGRVITVEASRGHVWLERALPEGTYGWRVRAAGAEMGETSFSRQSTFRLAAKPLPNAPEHLHATVEAQ